MKKRILALALLTLLLFAACSSSDGHGESSALMMSTTSAGFGGYVTNEKAAYDMEASYDAVRQEMGAAPAATPSTTEITATGQASSDIGRKLIRTGYYSLETMDYPKTIQQIEELVNTAGGYIQSSSTSGGGSPAQTYANPRWASYTVRVPADSFFSFTADLGGVATVVSSSQNTEEVTDYYYDTDARLKTLRVQEERLLTLMSQATELEAIIMLESTLSDVRYQIESNEGTLRRLDSQISFSTLNIEIREVFTPTKIEPVPITLGERIRARFSRTIENMKQGGENVLVVLIGDAPQILLTLLIIAVVVWSAVKVAKKARVRRDVRRDDIAKKADDDEDVPNK